jgi:triacylglycerol lipase
MLTDLSFEQRSLTLATLSSLAYNDYQLFDDLGYSSIFLNKGGSQTYVLWDKSDLIIVCRGTQPSEFKDLAHDLEFLLVSSRSGQGLVHHGFRTSVDLIWIDLLKLLQKYGSNRKLWCTGHSLGAAMATLIAARCARTDKLPKPTIYTYGSPRVGNEQFIKHMNSLNIEHHRWVNNEDIVTRNPVYPYKHHGQLHYFDHYGDVRVFTRWQTIKDRVKGFYTGLKKGKVNFFVNHLMENYLKNLGKL